MKITVLICLITFVISQLALSQSTTNLSFEYIEIDNDKGKWGDFETPVNEIRYFGLNATDVNFDGYKDVLSGRYLYLNPGVDMTGNWEKIDLGMNVDGMLFTDVDGDEFVDIIAESLPDVFWLESANHKGTSWTSIKIGNLNKTEHTNGQGYRLYDIKKGGKTEVMLSAGGGIYYAEIPENDPTSTWDFVLAAKTESEEGFVALDLNNDGYLDIVAGDNDADNHNMPSALFAYINPTDGSSNWERKLIGNSIFAIDRIETADIDNDGRADIVVTEERWPGTEPDAHLMWFKSSENPLDSLWERTVLATQFSMNNLDVGDIDLDGDIDIVTNEHKGEEHKTQIFKNDGNGRFEMFVVYTGKENHLGTQLFDLDQDGDLDIIGHGWDDYKKMHVWRNDAIKYHPKWQHLTTANNDLPMPNGGNQQTSCLVADLNQDGINDFVITDREKQPAVVGYIRNNDINNWDKIIIEPTALHIEAGSASFDIDDDGDIDIVFGGDGSSNSVWWWENPGNKHIDKPWKRYYIKNSGAVKHHDQMFIDVDNDGKKELVFWNQGDNRLVLAKIPKNPKSSNEWDLKTIYQYSNDSEMQQKGYKKYPSWKGVNEHEGLAGCDIDGDGIQDIVGGGLWFKYDNGTFIPNTIDAGYTFSRSVAGQFIKGGRPEVVMVVGDGKAPMYLYEWVNGSWLSKVIIAELDSGHTLDVLDFNKDGKLDIFSAEMRFGENNPNSKIRILLGDGKGNFKEHVVAIGQGVHEGKIADLDGDGDYDILAKPYSWEAPRVDVFLQEND